MARVKGPLMSMTASGSIAQGGLQFRQTRHGPQVVIPAQGRSSRQQPASPQQATIRAEVAGIAAEWRTLSPSARAWWLDQARATTAPNGWNLFLAARLNELRNPANMLTLPDGRPITDGYGRRLLV